MPGMSSGLHSNNFIIIEAFQSALRRQSLIIFVIVALMFVTWNMLRLKPLLSDENENDATSKMTRSSVGGAEPIGLRVLRISFGIIWIFDGILQAQASMPLGMTTQVIQPTAASSPSWVQHLINAAVTIWTNHPITAPLSAVWIQIGIGAWILLAPRGNWLRLGGLVSAGWGIVVWIFAESFGGIFAPGLTWLFGAPGAVLFYSLAGLLIALPERSWSNPRIGRRMLQLMGAIFIGMAVLQAWPGRGFWQGHLAHTTSHGTLVTMVSQMAATPQPHIFSAWVADFAAFDAAHGWAVNLFVVVALSAIGISFFANNVRIIRGGVIFAAVLCLADWVLIEDFGFFGGTGTDPNSMIPMSLIFIAGYLALTRPSSATIETVEPIRSRSEWLRRVTTSPAYGLRTLAAVSAVGVLLLGAAPVALASMNPVADPIINQAIAGSPNATNAPAPPFSLTDQFGHSVSLATLRGKTVAVTFLDPVCVSDCPLIAQEFRAADGLLGADAHRVVMVAIVINPLYRSNNYLVAFDNQEGMNHLANWQYLTGSVSNLQQVWNAFGVLVQYSTGGAMIAHNDTAFVIDAKGRIRYILNSDPGPGTAASKSSFASVLANAITSVTK
jgi:cytochrome oxidase Cu insertion factor (SCO1/SenC/PrrC family)